MNILTFLPFIDIPNKYTVSEGSVPKYPNRPLFISN